MRNWNSDVAGVSYAHDAAGNRTFMGATSDLTSTINVGYQFDALNRMTSVSLPALDGGAFWVSYGYDKLSRRKVINRANGANTTIAYDPDGDPDWQREVFPPGAGATSPNTGWFGLDYRFDRSARLTFVGSTDSAILGALPTAGTYGAANNLNRAASVPGRGGLPALVCRRDAVEGITPTMRAAG